MAGVRRCLISLMGKEIVPKVIVRSEVHAHPFLVEEVRAPDDVVRKAVWVDRVPMLHFDAVAKHVSCTEPRATNGSPDAPNNKLPAPMAISLLFCAAIAFLARLSLIAVLLQPESDRVMTLSYVPLPVSHLVVTVATLCRFDGGFMSSPSFCSSLR